jgi:hypothetical protein
MSLRWLRIKRQAICAYRSQMPLLGLTGDNGGKLDRMLVHEVLRGGEAIMWVSSS